MVVRTDLSVSQHFSPFVSGFEDVKSLTSSAGFGNRLVPVTELLQHVSISLKLVRPNLLTQDWTVADFREGLSKGQMLFMRNWI